MFGLKTIFSKYFPPKSSFIVGVSGGVDSMTLMHCLSKLKNYQFIIVTIDHGLRKTSSNDAAFVNEEAKKLGLTCYVKKVRVPTIAKKQRKGIEEAARDLRYQTFKRYQKKYQAKAIITAHHQDDQIESVLLHLLRGSDLHGLVGMKILSEQGIFRPLLAFSKKQIIAYAKKAKIAWVEDHTNQDIDFTRNLLRHHIAPKISPELLLKLSSEATKTITIFDQWVNNWLKKNSHISTKQITFEQKHFQKLPLYLQFYLLHHLTKNYLRIQHLSFNWLSGMYQWLLNSQSNSRFKYQQKTLLLHKNKLIFLYRKDQRALAQKR